MNVDREDELRIQAPPGAASASESWLQLDGTGMMPEAQERKRSTTAHTNSLKRNLKEKILRRRSAARGRCAAGMSWREEKERALIVKEVRRPAKKPPEAQCEVGPGGEGPEEPVPPAPAQRQLVGSATYGPR